MMFIHEGHITRFIPQRPPMVMISGILAVEEQRIRTGLHIQEDNIFVENGLFTAPGLMENIAQTAAARAGYLALQNNTPVPLGFIGAVKDLEIFALPPAGAFLETEAEVLHQVLNATLVAGKSMWNGQVVAQCEMKIFINP